MNSSLPISSFEFPSASSRSTSRSRCVRFSHLLGRGGAREDAREDRIDVRPAGRDELDRPHDLGERRLLEHEPARAGVERLGQQRPVAEGGVEDHRGLRGRSAPRAARPRSRRARACAGRGSRRSDGAARSARRASLPSRARPAISIPFSSSTSATASTTAGWSSATRHVVTTARSATITFREGRTSRSRHRIAQSASDGGRVIKGLTASRVGSDRAPIRVGIIDPVPHDARGDAFAADAGPADAGRAARDLEPARGSHRLGGAGPRRRRAGHEAARPDRADSPHGHRDRRDRARPAGVHPPPGRSRRSRSRWATRPPRRSRSSTWCCRRTT